MNCKPGDIAIVVRSTTGKILGRVVQVVRLHDDKLRDADGIRWISKADWPRWVLAEPIRNGFGELQYTAADASLRPIRDQPGGDVTLTWAPVPGERTEVPA